MSSGLDLGAPACLAIGSSRPSQALYRYTFKYLVQVGVQIRDARIDDSTPAAVLRPRYRFRCPTRA